MTDEGIAGVGKSVLAFVYHIQSCLFRQAKISRSLVLETISDRYSLDDRTGIAFIYFNFQDVQKSTNILATLIKQLCRKKKLLPDHLKRFCKSYSRNAESPSFEKLQAQLIQLSKTFDQVFFVVDAMDESQDRQNLLPLITALATESNIDQLSCNFKVFVTSRREKDIVASFTKQTFPTIEIEATKVDADIAGYVQYQLDTREDGDCVINQTLKDKIRDSLVSQSNGMWVS